MDIKTEKDKMLLRRTHYALDLLITGHICFVDSLYTKGNGKWNVLSYKMFHITKRLALVIRVEGVRFTEKVGSVRFGIGSVRFRHW